MAETISGSVSSAGSYTHTNSGELGTTLTGNPVRSFARNFSSSEITKLYYATLSVTTTPTVLDVTALTSNYGSSLNFGTVKELLIWNKNTTSGQDLTVGGGTNPLLNALPDLKAQTAGAGSNGSCVHLTTPITVSGSAKNIRLVAATGTLTVDIMIAGS